MATHHRRRRRISLFSATATAAASAVSVASVFMASTAAAAATAAEDCAIPEVITYKNYDTLLQKRVDCESRAAAAAQQQAILDEYADQVLSGSCDGYAIPFVENIFVSLYGDATAQEEWTDDVQNVFLDTVLDVLNECTDDCLVVDSVGLEIIEVNSFTVNQVFGDGGGRYLTDLGDDLFLTSSSDNGDITSTYLLQTNGTAAAATPTNVEEERQLQESSSTSTSTSTQNRRRKSRGKRKVAKIRVKGRNSSSKRASLLSKRKKKSDVVGDGRQLRELGEEETEADAGECGTLLLEELAKTKIDIFRCIANVELTSYNPITCVDGELINTDTDTKAVIGRSPEQPQQQSRKPEAVLAAQVEEDDEEIGNRPRGRKRQRNSP